MNREICLKGAASLVASCAGSLMPLIEGAICNFRNGNSLLSHGRSGRLFTLSRLTRDLPGTYLSIINLIDAPLLPRPVVVLVSAGGSNGP